MNPSQTAWQIKARTFVKKAKLISLRSALQLSGLLLPRLAAHWAEQLFVTPTRFRASRSESQVLARGSQGSLQLGPDLLRLWRWGIGPDVLLVHGWSGRGGQFAAWVDLLVEAGFRVTVVDAPGHGASSGQTASLVQFVHMIEAAQAQYGPFEAVVGHSLGGAAALIAAGRGLKVKRLVTLGAPADIQAVMKRAFESKMGLSSKVANLIKASLEARFGETLETLDPLSRARSLSQPLLVVHDLDDAEIPWAEAEALACAAGEAQLVTSKGLGHNRILRHAPTLMQVRAFLLGEASPGSPAMALILGQQKYL